MHMECAGLEKVPRGKWYCPQHANQPKASKPRPSSAKSSGELDSSLAPSTSGKAATAGPSAPSKTGANSKFGAGGKGKGRAQGQEDAAQEEGGKKSSGKAGKKRQAEAEPADLPPKPTGKAGSKAQGTGGSKAGKAQPDNAPTAAPARMKAGSGDVASKGSAEGGGKQKSGRGKEDSKKQPRDAPVQKGRPSCPAVSRGQGGSRQVTGWGSAAICKLGGLRWVWGGGEDAKAFCLQECQVVMQLFSVFGQFQVKMWQSCVHVQQSSVNVWQCLVKMIRCQLVGLPLQCGSSCQRMTITCCRAVWHIELSCGSLCM